MEGLAMVVRGRSSSAGSAKGASSVVDVASFFGKLPPLGVLSFSPDFGMFVGMGIVLFCT